MLGHVLWLMEAAFRAAGAVVDRAEIVVVPFSHMLC